MSNKKALSQAWGFDGNQPYEMTHAAFVEMARATKLRTLLDMSEREIRALEQLYGCPVIRPQRPRNAHRRRATVQPTV